MILPRPKKHLQRNNKFSLPFSFSFSCPEKDSEKALYQLTAFFPKASVSYSTQKSQIQAEYEAVKPEAYTLSINAKGVHIGYADALGLRNALATLSLLATRAEKGFLLPAGRIADEPETSHRGVMLDLARGIRPFDLLIEDIILIAKAKFNVLHLHLSDSKGICFEAEALPEACRIPSAYTKEQMKKVSELCEKLGLTVIPEFDLPAHSKTIVRNLPELGCDVIEGENTCWTVCPSTDRLYEIYQAIIDEIASLFPGPYFHIGGDELDFPKRPELRQLCHWENCRRCKERMEKENLDRRDLYYDCILKVYDMVKKHGREMIMWSDQLDCNREVILPTDIIMHYWRIAADGNGPRENCSLNAQLRMGYRAINSNYKDTYVDLNSYLTTDKLATWYPTARPEVDEDLKGQVLGSEMCVWEYGNAVRYPHYDRTLAPEIFLFADRLWNRSDPIYDEDYQIALTRAVLGDATPEGFNVFPCFGNLYPPRSEELAFYDRLEISFAEIAAKLGTLGMIRAEDFGSRARRDAYWKALIGILEKLKAGLDPKEPEEESNP